MKLFIPEIATCLTLSKEWVFNLYAEDRNDALLAAFEVRGSRWSGSDDAVLAKKGFTKVENSEYWKSYYIPVILPVGSILSVDRIYIRRGASEFSSISFNLNRKSIDPNFSSFAKKIKEGKGRCRFWAKLDDCNKIEFNVEVARESGEKRS